MLDQRLSCNKKVLLKKVFFFFLFSGKCFTIGRCLNDAFDEVTMDNVNQCLNHCKKRRNCGFSSYSNTDKSCTLHTLQSCDIDNFDSLESQFFTSKWDCEPQKLANNASSDPLDYLDPICNANEFVCANKNCVLLTYKCDQDDDCNDNSDEEDCNYDVWEDFSEIGK